MKRASTWRKVTDNPEKVWDIIIIGGGATGLGAAVDAASRGYETLLLEQYDFAKGTSSRSTKLVHGGVRYLAQGDISLVLEALEERGRLRNNAPHLFKDQEFIIPSYEWWGGPFYTIGLKVYDMMAGKLDLGASEYLSKEEVMEAIPNLIEEDLKGGTVYHDGQFDDSRLAINLAQTAVENGGSVVNYVRVDKLLKDQAGMVCGVVCTDKETGNTHEVFGRAVVNATGVFVDDILRMDSKTHKNTVVPSQGVHLVLDKSFLKKDYAIMIPHTTDGRVLFVVPWHGKLVVGTTDTLVDTPVIEPRPLEAEIDFILLNAAGYLRKAPQRKDVLSMFAGLRPLAAPEEEGKETKEISRGHKITISLSGLITITGGKWTTYRKMGQDLIDKAIVLGGLDHQPCVSVDMPIHGYVKNVRRADHMYVYGSDMPRVKRLIDDDPGLGEQLHHALPYLKAEVVWAVRYEMARTVDDILARRLRALFLDARASMEMSRQVAELMAGELGKDEKWVEEQVTGFEELAKGYLPQVQ
ncbi:MAG: glycerol-3-phosphate dehydrogenase/oxidase [Cyclobacteriaceae bacterium]|nr:glycerol-3-phosphate dehydrogenase/oxidase [Cyclobacteriaceae bacterium]